MIRLTQTLSLRTSSSLKSVCKSFASLAESQPVNRYETRLKHRTILSLYDLHPSITTSTFIAPSSSIIGEVYLHEYTSIGHNNVIRGDLNAISISSHVSIGAHNVICTVSTLPNGQQAQTMIGPKVTIADNCTLVSCLIKESSFIGSNSVILEGSVIEPNTIIAPNSVVPPGRMIPAGQVWAGSPVRYVRNVTEKEEFTIRFMGLNSKTEARLQLEEDLSGSTSYLFEQNEESDEHLAEQDIVHGSKTRDMVIEQSRIVISGSY